jgi:diguanylate cyclase (GGDEF)-like protein
MRTGRPASQAQRRAALLCCLVLVMATAMALPRATLPMPQLPGAQSFFGMSTLVASLTTTLLLFGREQQLPQGRAAWLAGATLFATASIAAYLLLVPQALVAGAILGDGSGAGWMWCAWNGGYGLLSLMAVLRRPRLHRYPGRIAALSLALALICLLLALPGPWSVPQLVLRLPAGEMVVDYAVSAVIGVNALATVLLMRVRNRSPIELWVSVSLLAATLSALLIAFGGESRFTVGWYLARTLVLASSLAVMVALLRDTLSTALRIASRNSVLLRQNELDPLTRVANRRLFDRRLNAEWRRVERSGGTLCVVIIDLDSFKSYNDRYGHLAGDDCLRQVASVLREACHRPGDLVARLGGEEFALLLPETSLPGAVGVFTAIQAGLERAAIPHEASPTGRVTASAGAAVVLPAASPGESSMRPIDLIGLADAALYAAKREGRDRISTLA